MGAASIAYGLFPETNPLLIAGIALVVIAGLQPLRARLQTRWENQLARNRRTNADWANRFQKLALLADEPAGGWQALTQCLRESSSLASHILFQLHSENGLFQSAQTAWTLSATGQLAASIKENNSTQSVSALSASPEERGLLRATEAQAIIPIFGEKSLEGFFLLRTKPFDHETVRTESRILETLAAAFHGLAASQAINWQMLAQELADVQSEPVLYEWMRAQISRWVPSLSFRIIHFHLESGQAANVFVLDHNRRRMEQEGIPFDVENDLCSLIAADNTPFFSDSSTKACQANKIPVRESNQAWAGLPFLGFGRPFGAVVLTRAMPFSDIDRSILTRFIDLAHGAFERTRWQARSLRSANQLNSLHRSAKRLASPMEMEQILQILLEDARTIADAAAGALYLSNRDGTWDLRKTLGEVSRRPISISEKFDAAARNPLPTRFHRMTEDETLHGLFPQAHRALLFPIHRKSQTPAVIALADPAGLSPFPEEDKEVWSTFSTLCALALDNSDLSSQTDPSLRVVVEELAALQRFDQELHAAADSASILSIALDWSMRRTNTPVGCALQCIDGTWQLSASRGYPAGSAPSSACNLVWVSSALEANRPAVLRGDDPSGYPGFLPGAIMALLLPIERANQMMGALFLEADWESAPAMPEVDVLQRVMAHTANALSNAQLRAEVHNANQAKSEFISFVAHELKTPMTSIRGYTDLLAQGAVGPVNPAQANFLSTIRTNADRLANLVSDLNDVSRIESGRLRLDYSQCSLSSALEEVMESLRSQLEAKEQSFSSDVSIHLPPVWADRGRLIQILTNIISNAHKYTPAGGTIRILAERSPNRWDETGAPDVIHLMVQDSGLGISPQDQKAIFQKFFRAEDRSIRDLPGTGLGLHITRNLIELQGGQIWFESELRKGSTFHFTLPVASV
jgi:signal transduction histidine kinase